MTLPKWTLSIDAEVREKGIDLSSHGISNVGWSVDCANEVISTLQLKGWAILGGDIFERQAGRFVHSYQSWECDINTGEPWPSYAERSCTYALASLSIFRGNPGLWFTAEVLEKPTATQLARSYDR
jgi:hypothetical protein